MSVISREAAIDLIDEYMDKSIELHYLPTGEGIKTLIFALPSVQQWIPVSERLPEPDERVLVYTVDCTYRIWDAMPHRADNYAWEDEDGLCHDKWEVDMWMPLPGPWRGEE